MILEDLSAVWYAIILHYLQMGLCAAILASFLFFVLKRFIARPMALFGIIGLYAVTVWVCYYYWMRYMDIDKMQTDVDQSFVDLDSYLNLKEWLGIAAILSLFLLIIVCLCKQIMIAIGVQQEGKNSFKMEDTFYIHQVVERLGLQKYYPRKLTREEVFIVSKNDISPDELNDDPSKIPWYMLQNLIMCNYEGRSFELEEIEPFEGKEIALSSATQKSGKESNHRKVSPIDALVAIFFCCDNFLRQILIEKLSTCQLAIPLLMRVTDVQNKQWELIVWGMSTITKKWQTGSGSYCERPMVVEKLPIVSALRIGRPKISKSKIINCVMNEQKHDIFFNSGCKGGHLERKLSDGLIEISWYLPTQKCMNAFSDALTFINLRGNASGLHHQTQFLSETSLVTIAFVASADYKESDSRLLESLYRQNGHVIFVLDGTPGKYLKTTFLRMEKNIQNVNKQVNSFVSSMKKELQISRYIWELLGIHFEGRNRNAVCDRSIEMCIEVAQKMNYHVDEMIQDCLQAKQGSEELIERVRLKGKQNELPLQMVTRSIAEMKREQHQLLKNMQTVEYVDRLKKEIDLRSKQLHIQQGRSERCVYEMFRASFTNSLSNRKYFFGFIKIMADRYSIDRLQPIRDKWNELCDKRKHEPETSKAQLESMTDRLELERQLSSESLGLEHFNREVGQNYEMSLSLKLRDPIVAEVAAEMLLHGYPIELMDGDAAHAPLTWIEAVFNSLKDQIGNKKLFVLSVLGIQSSGKSTMLNSMFGLQFAVSACRCTKGIFAQLISLDEDLREDTQCHYILVVDTEGLWSPEFASIHQSYYRHNELATFVIGLSDLTLLNIKGEDATDMQDTLQIAVHAFMKMENVNINPNCLFVHQNVTDVSASDLNATQQSMRETLNKMTKFVAEAENCSGKYKSFSDVIKFHEDKHIMYTSSLWQGDPPMAPPNPGYSKYSLRVKKQVLEIMNYSKPKSIGEFTTLLSDLWRAICQNSLDIQAFYALNKEYEKHARTFRRNTLTYSARLQTKFKKLRAEKMKKEGGKILNEYILKLQNDIGAFQLSMASYFEEEEKACQWKCKMDSQRDGLCKEIENELRDVFKSMRNKAIRRVEIDPENEMKFILEQEKTSYKESSTCKEEQVQTETEKISQAKASDEFPTTCKEKQESPEQVIPKEGELLRLYEIWF
ncbi:interferon-induced very large GTPase 1-like [Antedon mediterranea]|uniref:interferon-induced very large GTPase 1-like n=1 Tax=Antedon mediterranea TaxID=105859 RepID=UPI003AF81251